MSDYPIAITGMHRSGTSMITRGLHESGLHLMGGDADALLAAADDNPEGFWENKAIVNCNDDLLEAAGGAWDNPPSLLPQAVDDPRLASVVEPATAALAGLAENDRWGFKDPRLCLTAAFWLDLQPDLRFVICVRNPLEVALSLKKRNQNSYSLGLTLWERYYESILELVPVDRRIITHYDSYFLDPVGELGRVCDFAGLNAAKLEVRTDLRHHDVGVSLDEANLGGNVRALYQTLCEEGGAMVPRSAVPDEGQVRRLVLDGTVSARHAEQRQQAIVRLEERLVEAQQTTKELRDELAAVRRQSDTAHRDLSHREHDLEQLRGRIDQLVAGQADLKTALRGGQAEIHESSLRLIDTAETIADLTHSVKATASRVEERQNAAQDGIDHIDAILGAVHNKLRAVEDTVSESSQGSGLGGRLRALFGKTKRRAAAPTRRVAAAGMRRGAPAAKRTAKATVKRMPAPVQNNLRRVRRAMAAGQAGNRVKERGAKVTAKLPAPAQKVARKGASIAKSSGVVPKATRVAKGVNRRLPGSAKKVVNRLAPSPSSGAGRTKTPTKKAAPAPRPKQTTDGRTTAVPKGPAAYKWQKGFERLTDEFVPAGATVAVALPGCKNDVEKISGRHGVAFPSADAASPPADAISLIAVLEALRLSGCERLAIPEGARTWFNGHPEFRDHLAANYLQLADREAAGVVIDLASPAPAEQHGLLAEIGAVASRLGSGVAVLDWTTEGVASELPGLTVFAPPVAASTLPYFDQSVDVVVACAEHDLEEARRVASAAVIVVSGSGAALAVTAVESIGVDVSRSTIAVCAPSVSTEIDAALAVQTSASNATLHLDVSPASLASEADVVVALDAGIVPLPGALDALVSEALASTNALAIAKVLDGQGRLESAGGMVFSDGSTAGIGAGSLDVRAPWHEFARPVCYGQGAIAAVTAVWASLGDGLLDGIEISEAAWRSGIDVTYRPKSVMVRATGSVAPTTWAGPDAKRPERPDELADGAWRYLLANDDPTVLKEGS